MRRRGVSFVEILVASVVLVALVFPLLVVFSSTLKTTEVSIQEVWAQHLATELMEQLKVLPYTLDYEWIPTRPVPNPYPAYPHWLSLAEDGELPILGLQFPTDKVWKKTAEGEIVTDDWLKTGRSILYENGTTIDKELLSRSRLYLSPLPEGFKRYIQLYRPDRSRTPLVFEENIVKAVIRIEWASARTKMRSHKRKIEMRGLICNHEI